MLKCFKKTHTGAIAHAIVEASLAAFMRTIHSKFSPGNASCLRASYMVEWPPFGIKAWFKYSADLIAWLILWCTLPRAGPG